MFEAIKWFILLLPLFLPCQSALSETVQDRLAWPRVLNESFGNPEIKVFESSGDRLRVSFLRPARVVRVSGPPCGREAVNRAVAEYFAGLFWEKFLSEKVRDELDERLHLREIIPLTKQDVVKIGSFLMRGKSCGSAVRDAWWKVRTGCPLTESRSHLLGIASLKWDEEGSHSFGHYAICLRERGGNSATDAVFDFRAPWLEDRRPRFSEAPNIHNRLKIAVFEENLYDWAYTQSEYRNCDISIGFVKIHEEQVTLLRSWQGRIHQAGNFRAFKKNCSSLGTRFVNRLLPVDDPVPGQDSLFDIPNQAKAATEERFGGTVEEVTIKNFTAERGHTPTSKTEIHFPEQGRSNSRPFLVLKKIPSIN